MVKMLTGFEILTLSIMRNQEADSSVDTLLQPAPPTLSIDFRVMPSCETC